MDSDGWEWAAWPSKRTHGTEGTRKENEIWIRTRASISDSVRKAIDLLEVKGYNEIVFKAMGSAVQKALNIVELVKKSIVGLHESTYMDHSTPVSSITITLSKKGLDDSNTDSDDEGLSKRTHARVGTREENEIWIPARASVSDYVRKAITLLEVKGYNEIVLKAMGSAVQKALLIAESVKKSIVGLHESTYMDHSTPVSSITITLSKKGLDDSNTDSDDEGLSKRTHARVGTREENEIWISARAPISDYVRNAICLLEVKGHNEIVLKAMGSAVQNALNIAELVKRSIACLHGSTDMDYTGLVSNVTITLSKRALNASSRGYQCSESGHSMGSSWDNWSGHSGIGSWIETSYEGLDSGYLACDGGSGEEEKKQGSIFCLKKNVSMKEIEEVEDCVILESNPFEPVDLSKKLSQNDQHTSNDEQDLFVTAERGQVACRDYPHSRHLCVKFPFDKTPHVSYCEQCYCYVCDLKAPCNSWTQTAQGHCHATDQEFMWKIMRATKAEFAKTTATSTSSFQQPSHLSFSNHQSIIAETSATVASPFQQRSLRPQQPSHLPFSNHNSRHPTVKWAQRSDKVFITIELPDAKDVRLKLEPEGKLFFSATSGVDNIPYEVDIDLYDKVNVNESKARVGLRNICYLVEKAEKKWWSRLIKQGKPPVFLKVDWDKWVDEDEEQEHSFGADVTFGDMDFSKLNMDDQEGFDVDDEVGSYHSCDELEDSFIW